MAKKWVGLDGRNVVLLDQQSELADATDFSGGGGVDHLYLSTATIDLTVKGGAGDDWLFSGSGNDKLFGGEGNDFLSAGAGNDIVSGGSGSDALQGGAGNDTINGGSGMDQYNALGLAGHGETINLSKHFATDGVSTDVLNSIENVGGSYFDDNITGNKGANWINGSEGNDTIRGMGGADVLFGDSTSKGGNDTFVFTKKDVADHTVDKIMDFGSAHNAAKYADQFGHDTIDLRDFFKGHKGAAIDDMVHVTEHAEGSTVSVNVHGTFVDVVDLIDVHGVTASSLLHDGHILS
jgi:Ca2+-binding RTX toxin-like protein